MYNKEMQEKPSSMQKFNIAIDECLSKESQGLRRQSTKTGKPRINKGADAHVLYLENIIQRTNSFFSVVNLIRKRVNFYGVYKAHDSIDLVLLKINMARKLLRKIKEQMY